MRKIIIFICVIGLSGIFCLKSNSNNNDDEIKTVEDLINIQIEKIVFDKIHSKLQVLYSSNTLNLIDTINSYNNVRAGKNVKYLFKIKNSTILEKHKINLYYATWTTRQIGELREFGYDNYFFIAIKNHKIVYLLKGFDVSDWKIFLINEFSQIDTLEETLCFAKLVLLANGFSESNCIIVDSDKINSNYCPITTQINGEYVSKIYTINRSDSNIVKLHTITIKSNLEYSYHVKEL